MKFEIKNEDIRIAVEQAYGFDKQYGALLSSGSENFIEHETYEFEEKCATYHFFDGKLVGYQPWQ